MVEPSMTLLSTSTITMAWTPKAAISTTKGLDLQVQPIFYGTTDKGYVMVPWNPYSNEGLATTIAAQGPISVAIDASHKSFQFYHHGIYHEPGCVVPNLCHGMLVVGYGLDYWLVKNSWGTKWGDESYIKIARGEDDCGITLTASYPLV